jgi:hypothetical protein
MEAESSTETPNYIKHIRATSQKKAFFIVTAVKTSNPAMDELSLSESKNKAIPLTGRGGL